MPSSSRQSRLLALASRPIRTAPNTTSYEWAGATLQRLLKTPSPVAETWAFFSGPQRPAEILTGEEPSLGPLTMQDAVAATPELLGPNGSDPDNAGQKYFFVKFLDPSDFPPFAYVGFNPEAVAALKRSEPFPACLAELLWQDRRLLEALADAVRSRVASPAAFAELKAAYKGWAIAQAAADWTAPLAAETLKALAAFTDGGPAAISSLLTQAQEVRRTLTGLLHRIPFEENHAILIETPTLHAIAGLSLQIHPKVAGNFHPKDEAWLYTTISDEQGARIGWALVEPQRTFDKTESLADFFTPFAWTAQGLGFRKTITREELARCVAMTDTVPRPRAHYVRTAQPLLAAEGALQGQARWYRTIEEPAWPYFLVRELRFTAAGEATTPLAHHSFSELHVTQGAVEVALARAGAASYRFTVTAAQPALLPATLPYDTISYRAAAAARLYFITRPA